MRTQEQGLTVIFGGSFDPVHFGHIKPALELAKCSEVEQVRFLPCHAHADKNIVAADKHRTAMLKLIVHTDKTMLDLREMQRDGISYTVDTLEEVRAELGPDQPLAFLLGHDVFLEITDWHCDERIMELAHLIVLSRDDNTIPDNHRLVLQSGGWSLLQDLIETPAGKLCQFHNQRVDLSSSQVRNHLANGEEPRYLLPATVWQYIQRHNLYRVSHG